jgi:VanZ family protein
MLAKVRGNWSGAKRRLLMGACAAVSFITLNLGLWPFHAPRNDVSWVKNQHALRFGRYSTISTKRGMTSLLSQGPCCSLEIWLECSRIWDFSTFLTFYLPGKGLAFSMHQLQKRLSLQTEIQDDRRHTATRHVYVDDVFHKTGPTFITLVSSGDGTDIYIDGTIAKRMLAIRLAPEALAGQLIVGDSAEQADSWSGQLRSISVYNGQLTPREILENYGSWTQKGKPSAVTQTRAVATYLFNEGSGKVIRSSVSTGSDLQIPQTYNVPGQLFLESPWHEFQRSNDYFGATIKNIIGFLPFGFCFYALLSLDHQATRAAMITVLLGAAASLTIELLQTFLPTRASGVMDLITNPLGTYIGVWLYRAADRTLAAWWPWQAVFGTGSRQIRR